MPFPTLNLHMCAVLSHLGGRESWVGNAGLGESTTEDVVKWFLSVFKA